MTTSIELWFYYALVLLTLVSVIIQFYNVQRTRRRFGTAVHMKDDGDRLLVARADLIAELLRMAAHLALFISLGWLILLRWLPTRALPSQPVSFTVFAGGLSLIPLFLLLMSVNIQLRDKKLTERSLKRRTEA